MQARDPGVYFMTNYANTVIYIGATGIGLERVQQHKDKLVPGFTKAYNLTKLVRYEPCETIEQAFERERQLKNWHRQWKINLIEQDNPEWKDIFDDLINRS